MNLFRTILKDRSLKPMLSFVLFVLVLVLLYLIYDRTLREGARGYIPKANTSSKYVKQGTFQQGQHVPVPREQGTVLPGDEILFQGKQIPWGGSNKKMNETIITSNWINKFKPGSYSLNNQRMGNTMPTGPEEALSRYYRNASVPVKIIPGSPGNTSIARIDEGKPLMRIGDNLPSIQGLRRAPERSPRPGDLWYGLPFNRVKKELGDVTTTRNNERMFIAETDV